MVIAEFAQYLFGFSIFITSLFLVMLVLVQRGRGGGLTGALGGAGGQSAFGTKAGDLFTRITVGVAAVWIFLCAASVFFLRDRALPQTGVTDRDLPGITGELDTSAGNSSGTTGGAEGSQLNLPFDVQPPSSVPTSPGAATNAAATPTGEAPATVAPPSEAPATQTPQAEVSDPSELGQAPTTPDAPAEPTTPAAQPPTEAAPGSATINP